jgi:hypothetical protein
MEVDLAASSTHVFLLWHKVPSGHDGAVDMKLIGAFESKSDAADAQRQTSGLPGFVDHPDCFSIERLPLDRDLRLPFD